LGVLDIIILAILGIAAYKGYKNGLVVSLISLLSLVIALVASFHFTGKVSDYFIGKYPGNEEAIPIAVFILLLILTIVLITIVGKLLKKILDLTLLGSFDNLAGALFGIIKWGFFLSVFLWGLSYLNIVISDKYASESILLAYIEPLAPFIFNNVGAVLPFIEELLKPLKNIGENQSEFFTLIVRGNRFTGVF